MGLGSVGFASGRCWLRRLGFTFIAGVSLVLAFVMWNGAPKAGVFAAAQRQAAITQASSSQPSATSASTPAVAGTQLAGEYTHEVKRGESVPSLARFYLPQTSFMTVSELEAAIRASN